MVKIKLVSEFVECRKHLRCPVVTGGAGQTGRGWESSRWAECRLGNEPAWLFQKSQSTVATICLNRLASIVSILANIKHSLSPSLVTYVLVFPSLYQ